MPFTGLQLIVQATAPANTVAPVVSGSTTVGSVLSCTTGTWTGDPTPTPSYQWQRDTAGNGSFSNIGSATSSTYTLVDADDGNKVRCVVTETNSAGAVSANSNAVGTVVEAAVPANTVAPAVTGTTQVGSVLTTSNGTWTGMGGHTATYAYQWQRDAQGSGSYSNISSATSSTYTLVDADDACHIKCIVTATNDVGAGTGTASNIVGVVAEPVPTNSVAPTVSGSTPVGSVLTAATGTWTHMAGTVATYAYQWTRDGSNISSATSSTYTTVSGDAGHAVGVKVTATNTGGASSAAASSNTVTVTATAPVNTLAPVASGSTTIGSVLSVTNGTWTGSPAPTFSYQWQRSGVDIGSATANTYTLVTADDGLPIRCNVTGTNTAGSATAASNAITDTTPVPATTSFRVIRRRRVR